MTDVGPELLVMDAGTLSILLGRRAEVASGPEEAAGGHGVAISLKGFRDAVGEDFQLGEDGGSILGVGWLAQLLRVLSTLLRS